MSIWRANLSKPHRLIEYAGGVLEYIPYKERDMPMELNPGWKLGPLPPNSYQWGAIVTKDMAASYPLDGYRGGVLLADFCGDHAKVWDCSGKLTGYTRYEPDQIALYNNSLMMPTLP